MVVRTRSSPQVVVGDLGLVELADPHLRLQKKLRPSDNEIAVCTLNYRPPDVLLGSQCYGEDFDVWCFGLVAAGL
jgi:serine/threonine protein kinase